MEHLMGPLTGLMKNLGNPDVTEDLKQTIVEAVLRESGDRSVDQLAQQENEVLVVLLKARARHTPPAVGPLGIGSKRDPLSGSYEHASRAL
jgi:hypothetical protein